MFSKWLDTSNFYTFINVTLELFANMRSSVYYKFNVCTPQKNSYLNLIPNVVVFGSKTFEM